jgi:hypothetical protein
MDGWMNVWMDDEWTRNTFPSGSSSLVTQNGFQFQFLLPTYKQPTSPSICNDYVPWVNPHPSWHHGKKSQKSLKLFLNITNIPCID